jgi:hypothetical protein
MFLDKTINLYLNFNYLLINILRKLFYQQFVDLDRSLDC